MYLFKEVNNFSFEKILSSSENTDNFEYKFSLLRFQAYDNGDEYLILDPAVFIFNKGNGVINKNSLGSYKNINRAKNTTQAYYNTNHKFFFFTYKTISNHFDKIIFIKSIKNISNY